MNSNIVYGIGGIILGGAVSSFVTYRVLRKQMETEIDTAVVEIRAHYEKVGRKTKGSGYADLEKLQAQYREENKAYLEGLRGLGYASEDAADADPKFDKVAWAVESGFDKSVNIADLDIDTPEYDEDEAEPIVDEHKYTEQELRRNGDGPYVISYEEYSDEHSDFGKTSIMYYAGDKTLTDEAEEVVPDAKSIVGKDSLTRFGDMSHDKNVVYVRNENIAVDFEITRSPGRYSVIVLGQAEPAPRKRAPRKMTVND